MIAADTKTEALEYLLDGQNMQSPHSTGSSRLVCIPSVAALGMLFSICVDACCVIVLIRLRKM